MTWESPGTFFAMGGYALYVWGSFGACALALGAETWMVARRMRLIREHLRLRALADQVHGRSE